MNIRRFKILAIASLLAVKMLVSPSQADMNRPNEGAGPTRVKVSILIVDVNEIDTASQSFTANVYYEARWHDPRLAHDGSGETERSLDAVWNPRLQFVNQRRLTPTMQRVVRIASDGGVVYRQRVWGAFSQPMNFKDFPLDMQTFEVILASAGYEMDEVELIPDPERKSDIASNLSLVDWRIREWSAGTKHYKFTPEDPGVGLFSLWFQADRETGYYLAKIIFPLTLIIAMSWLVFWIDPKMAASQISVAITSMLTLIAYRFVVGGMIPKISYLTRMDIFIFGSTVLIFLTLIQVVWTSVLADREELDRARKVDRWCRFFFPMGFIIIVLVAFFF